MLFDYFLLHFSSSLSNIRLCFCSVCLSTHSPYTSLYYHAISSIFQNYDPKPVFSSLLGLTIDSELIQFSHDAAQRPLTSEQTRTAWGKCCPHGHPCRSGIRAPVKHCLLYSIDFFFTNFYSFIFPVGFPTPVLPSKPPLQQRRRSCNTLANVAQMIQTRENNFPVGANSAFSLHSICS